MEKLVIEGGVPLNGEITPAGNKNAALPLLAACLLTDKPITLHNVPNIRDVQTIKLLLESLGVSIDTFHNNGWNIHAKEINSKDLDPELLKENRASILLVGPMTART